MPLELALGLATVVHPAERVDVVRVLALAVEAVLELEFGLLFLSFILKPDFNGLFLKKAAVDCTQSWPSHHTLELLLEPELELGQEHVPEVADVDVAGAACDSQGGLKVRAHLLLLKLLERGACV